MGMAAAGAFLLDSAGVLFFVLLLRRVFYLDSLNPFELFQRLIGIGSVTLTSPARTVSLCRRHSTSKSDEATNLRGVVEQITRPVRLNPFLFNGHVQTAVTALGWTGPDIHVHYKRKVWKSDSDFYPGQFCLDFVVPSPAEQSPRDRSLPPRTHHFTDQEWAAFIDQDAERPLLIMLHGFLGGSHEKYMRHAVELFTKDEPDSSFTVAVMNARGCAYSKITSPYLYHPGATWDLRQFVKWCRKQWPKRRLFAVGFSIGANLLCNYLGEEGDKCELEAAVLVGNPWNLDVTNTGMADSWFGLNVYNRALGTSFRKTYERHKDEISKAKEINSKNTKDLKFLWQWDRAVQCPTWGFPSETSYYRDTSCIDAVAAIRTPTLALHAKDDPVCIDAAVPYYLIEQNPNVVMCASSIGGHLGWFEYGGERWSNRMIYSFLQHFAKDLAYARPLVVEGNGQARFGECTGQKPLFKATRRKMTYPLQPAATSLSSLKE